MRRIGPAVGLAAMLLLGTAAAAQDAAREAKAATKEASEVAVAAPEVAKEAEQKSEILEEKASPEGGQEPPAPEEKITRVEARAVDPAGDKPLDDPLTCLARTIYWETKGEGRAAMEAVANVVMNRLGRPEFPNSVCGIVKEGQEKGACQFSWWCDGRPDDVEEPEPYAVAKDVARAALNRDIKDNTDGALYFHLRKVNPGWANEYVKTAEVGDHLFYKPEGDKAK
jgi:spore germination cell wall hydrolase CwlJ-like protein